MNKLIIIRSDDSYLELADGDLLYYEQLHPSFMVYNGNFLNLHKDKTSFTIDKQMENKIRRQLADGTLKHGGTIKFIRQETVN